MTAPIKVTTPDNTQNRWATSTRMIIFTWSIASAPCVLSWDYG